MSDSDLIAAGAMVAGIIGFLVVIGIVWYVLQVIALWKTFTKAGEAGWKAIIPVYNTYVLYKITWNTKMFWVYLGLCIVYGVLSAFEGDDASLAILLVDLVVLIAACVIGIMQLYKFSLSYGHGAGWTVGLVFLNPIFMLMIGLGSSQYIGPEGRGKQVDPYNPAPQSF